MCGIVGGTNPEWPYAAAVNTLRHRGPDAQKVVHPGMITLGFARLAIIDLSESANQPMSSTDGNVWVVFNGEVYGFQKVRQNLEAAGCQFETQSDTEVVLQAYLTWGDKFIDRLDGMFAIGIYDRRDEKLRLYRDRPGIKPLYYFWDGNEFAFASELKAIEQLCADTSLKVDNTAIYDFLTYRYVPAPKTLYRSVCKLPPAHLLVFDVHNKCVENVSRYWELRPDRFRNGITTNEAGEQLRQLIEASVGEQLVADVPVGCFLSGGMDSSVVVASAVGHRDYLKTFSIGFEIQEHSETHFARLVADALSTDHEENIFGNEQLEALFPNLKSWYDEPFGDTSAFPTYFVSKQARQSVTVALSGDGGDELLGGYRWYRRFRRLKRLGATVLRSKWSGPDRLRRYFADQAIPRGLCSLASLVFAEDLALYTKLMGGMTCGEKWQYATLLEIDKHYDDYWYFREHWRTDLPPLSRLQYLDFHTYLPDDILTKVDRASMANSLEVRVPFLSKELIEFTFSLPESILYHGGELKGLMKLAYKDVLPQEIISREKKGFSVPREYESESMGRPHERIVNELFGFVPSDIGVASCG